MTLTQLQILVAVVDCGGFTAAAARLGIGQTAVSHTLRALERELGASLVTRGPPSQISDAGRRLLPHAREMLAQAEAIRREAQAAGRLATGTLRLGSFGPTSSLRLLPELTREYARRYPGIEVQVDEAEDEVVAQWVLERRVEIGFAVLPDRRFETVPLTEDEYVAILPARHSLAARRTVPVEAFDGLPFVLSGVGSMQEIERILDAASARPRIVFRLRQIISILGVVASGLGVSIAARLALPPRHAGVVYRPLSPTAARRIGLSMRELTQLTPAARAFVEVAQRWARRRASASASVDEVPLLK